jgi:hypothetical protein
MDPVLKFMVHQLNCTALILHVESGPKRARVSKRSRMLTRLRRLPREVQLEILRRLEDEDAGAGGPAGGAGPSA